MNATKPPWASVTIWTSVGNFLVLVLVSVFGFEMTEETKQIVIDNTIAIGGAVAVFVLSALNIWGRVRSKTSISFSAKPVNPKLP
jgi:protein-S-isoprenylcysteine O-methyltransferase Ste14